MRTLGKKIKDLRTLMGMGQKQFGDALGQVDGNPVDQSTVSRWENNKQKPSPDETAKIAALANITPQQLLGIDVEGKGGRRAYVTGEVQAGNWVEAAEWPVDDRYEVPAPLPPEWDSFEITARVVTGTSMNRYYPDGSIVYVVALRDLGRKPESGERVIVQRVNTDGEYEISLKEYVVDPDGKKWLWPRSDDPRHQAPLELIDTRRTTEQVQVIGIVIASLIIETVKPPRR